MNRIGDIPRIPFRMEEGQQCGNAPNIYVELPPKKKESIWKIITLSILAALSLLGAIKLTEWEVRQEERATMQKAVQMERVRTIEEIKHKLRTHQKIDGMRVVWTKEESK